jgi:hypothetical protein
MSYTEINSCRICGNVELAEVVHLGQQTLTGVFPRDKNETITSGPLELVKCVERDRESNCGLVQLKQTYDLGEMYGLNYGYRSGLNPSMVRHLGDKVNMILGRINVARGDVILDIGSNDGTLLKSYSDLGATLIGIDPTGHKFLDYYPGHITLIPDFFSHESVSDVIGSKKAKIITSIAMFYDLERPIEFMMQVRDLLADDGLWVFEQSYMPTMLAVNAYDTICHEHLEYYRLKQLKWMVDRVGLRILDVEFNDVNGGSFSVVACLADATAYRETASVDTVLADEEKRGLGTSDPYEAFRSGVYRHREKLMDSLHRIKASGATIFGYGASTKGNVILQFCGLTDQDINFMAEVNADKFGCFTPGTRIPIIAEDVAKSLKPDYFLVMPWHFRDFIVEKERGYISSGGNLIFPLPELDIVSGPTIGNGTL